MSHDIKILRRFYILERISSHGKTRQDGGASSTAGYFWRDCAEICTRDEIGREGKIGLRRRLMDDAWDQRATEGQRGGRGEDEVLRDHEREIGKRDEGNNPRKANGKQKDEPKNVETK